MPRHFMASTKPKLVELVWRNGLKRRNRQLKIAELWLDRTDVQVLLECLFDELALALARPGDSVRWPGFGTWTVRERPARDGRHPRTGARIWLHERVVVRFRPDEGWRAFLQEARDKRRRQKTDPVPAATP